MNKQKYNINFKEVEVTVEKKYQKQDRRKKIKMKVTGASVRHLQKIIKNK